jgi:polyhydroxybutyrate depolymerase
MPIIFPPVPMMLDRWRRATGCLTMRAVSTLVDPHEPALVTRVEDFGPGRDDGEMRIVTVEGGGHTWPGRAPIVSYLGPWTTAFSASSLIWEFFAGKRRR